MVGRMASRHKISRRWAAPALVLLAIAGIGVGPNLLSASASPPNLPPLTPAELLVKARTAQVVGLSGTAQLTSNLGLPSLDMIAGLGGGGSDTTVASLLAGTHTAQVWMDGPDKIRVVTAAPLAETNWIRNGTDVWSYDSATLTATHATVASNADAVTDPPDTTASSVPDPVHDDPVTFAQSLLDKVTPSTTVSIDRTKLVAGRAAYQLALSPNTPDSTISEVVFAVDAATGLPLDIKVTARSTGSTALELGFTSVDFSTPAASTFDFTPPPGSTVVEASSPASLLGAGGRSFDGERRQVKDANGAPATDSTSPTTDPTTTDATESTDPVSALGDKVTTVGSDWTTAAIISGASIPSQIGPLLDGAERIQVGSTSARVLTTTLFTVLILDDGRVAVGAVSPTTLASLVAGATS